MTKIRRQVTGKRLQKNGNKCEHIIAIGPNNGEVRICTKDLEKQLYDIYLKEKYERN